MELISKETLKSAVRAFSKELDFRCTVNSIVNMQPIIDAIPKADYENRLKADMVAMLTELQLEIEEMSGLVTEIHGEEWNEINVIHSQDVLSFIQQKIDKLKGNEDGDK